MASAETLEDGVIFRREDCANIGRRLLAAFVDGIVLLTFALAWEFVCYFVVMDTTLGFYLWLASFPVFWTAYLGPLKRSVLGTPGYRLAGIRVVSLAGRVPGLWPMFLRSTAGILWALTGSVMFFIDLFWIGDDGQRQSLRDKVAGTIVVLRAAEPIGMGKQRVRLYSFLGWALYLREVVPVQAPESSARPRTEAV